MALLFADNFQQYAVSDTEDASTMTDGEVYAETLHTWIKDDPDSTATTQCLMITADAVTNEDGVLRKVLPAGAQTVGCAFRLWLDNLPATQGAEPVIFTMRDSTNEDIVGIRVRTDGYIEARRGPNLESFFVSSGGTLLGTTTGPAIVAGAWQQVEVKILSDATVGTVQVKVDGIQVLNLSGKNTGGAECTQIAHVQYHAAGAQFYMKDYAVWNTTGSNNNDFLGNFFVHSMIPDGDVSGTWSLTGAATAFEAIDESPAPDDDTSYMSSAWPAATAQICTVSDLPPEATRVLGMMTMVRAIKTDGGDGNLTASLVSATNTVDGADTPVTTAYSYWTDIFETDPDTSAIWTVAAANAVKLKINRTL